MRINILYRYVAGKFWVPFFFSMAMFCILVLLGDFFENAKNLTNGHATFGMVLKYCFLNLPGWIGMLIPVACLLAALFVISDMVAGGEWTACLASGYRPRQLFGPIVFCILAVVLTNSFLQEFWMPKVSQRAEEVFYQDIRGQEGFSAGMESDVTLKIDDGEMLLAQRMKSGDWTMYGVTLDKYDAKWEIQRQIAAQRLEWDDDSKQWFFSDGVIRDFNDQIGITETAFDRIASPLTVRPKDITIGETEGKTSSVRMLLKKISFLGHSGLVTYKEKTNLHNKLATPIMTVLMCLLGMPFAITVRKKSKIINIIAALVMSFGFWWIMSMAVTAGENGILNPILAGWGVTVLCAGAVALEFKFMKV